MNFRQAEVYLLSLGNEVSAMKLGLENIRKLLAALGNPEKNYLKVQVAGTNGKGSVCAFLNSICLQAGIRTGMYTSPHLVSITERVQINGVDISETDFARLATHVRETAEKLLGEGLLDYRPTFFEQVTTIALLAFAEAKVELAILETGLGGRLDATTAANAEIAAITQIDYDHQNHLGDTIEEIAAEKAAIVRENTHTVIIGRQTHEAATNVILQYCEQVGIEPRLAGSWESVPGAIATGAFSPAKVKLGLAGRHQIENAEVAVLLAEDLSKRFPITKKHIREGLKNARHPGRMEFLDGMLLDGAHNVAGARALREFLDESINRPIVMIFGAMRDKDIREIARILFQKAETLILTKAENSRAITPEEIAETIRPETIPENQILTETAAEALNAARKVAGGEKLILVTGSLYLVGEVKGLINKTLDKQ